MGGAQRRPGSPFRPCQGSPFRPCRARAQVWSQPFFEYVDIHVDRAKRFPPALGGGRPWLFRLWFRSLYNVVITFFAILLPFAGVIVGFVGAVGFWPLTVFFPIECWIRVFKPRPPLKKALRVRSC